MIALGRRRPPDPLRLDPEGRVRVIAPAVGFEEAVDEIFDGLRWHLRSDPLVAAHALHAIGTIAEATPGPGDCLRRQARALLASAEEALPPGRDVGAVRSAAAWLEGG